MKLLFNRSQLDELEARLGTPIGPGVIKDLIAQARGAEEMKYVADKMVAERNEMSVLLRNEIQHGAALETENARLQERVKELEGALEEIANFDGSESHQLIARAALAGEDGG